MFVFNGRRTIALTYFFFQAEDGIRDYKVTGVQTCALPIWTRFESVSDKAAPGDFPAMIFQAACAADGSERREAPAGSARLCQSNHARKAAKHRSAERNTQTLGSPSRSSLPGPWYHSFIQTTASGRSERAAASTMVGARAPLDEACAKIIGSTSALKPESLRNASRQNPNVSDVFSTSAVRSDGLPTEPKSGTTSRRARSVFVSSAGSRTPWASALSAQITAAPPDVERMPTPAPPDGGFDLAMKAAVSSTASRLSTAIAPASSIAVR